MNSNERRALVDRMAERALDALPVVGMRGPTEEDLDRARLEAALIILPSAYKRIFVFAVADQSRALDHNPGYFENVSMGSDAGLRAAQRVVATALALTGSGRGR